MKRLASLLLAAGAMACWPILIPAISQTQPTATPGVQSGRGSPDATAPEDRIAAKLAEYDQKRGARLLRVAATEASMHDREPSLDPALRLHRARQRIAGWLAILARLKRDIDPGFDLEPRPSNDVQPPPSAAGGQLPAGIDPSEITDPKARAAYIAEIARNDDHLAIWGPMAQLFVSRPIILARALQSIQDAHRTLGLPAPEIRAMAAAADITPADRDAISNALE